MGPKIDSKCQTLTKNKDTAKQLTILSNMTVFS